MTNKERIQSNNNEIRELIEIAENLPDAGGGGSADPVLQKGEATPTKAVQKFTPGTGYDGFSEFTVKAIPDEYVIPAGSVTITKNGEHNVAGKAVAKVSVPIPDGYIKPRGTQTITANGNYDIKSKANVQVNVLPALQEKKATENGTVVADAGYDGLSKVIVDVDAALPTQTRNISITKNGNYLVDANPGYSLSEVNISVNVPIPDGYIKPIGTKEITENGTHDVTAYASVNVNVTGGSVEPKEYQRVEYIESDGSAYIVTDFVADDNTCGIEAVIDVGNYNSNATMGSREDSGNTRFYLPYPLGASSVYYGFNSSPKITATVSQTSPFRWQTNFLNSRLAGVYTFDGASVGSAAITENLTPHTVPVAIFGLYSGVDSGVKNAKNMKLYSARCSKGFDVVREYIPCYRKSDGVIGLYEKISGTFLTTPVSAFTKGADIDW